ncbi:MAG: tyrosine-type recombinase/integrase, partial [Thermaerobacter sp.]|nr:tyrosine-type recombinase/integrase [Thermaerobacter sp.]
RTFRTRREAEDWLARVVVDVGDGYAATDLTVGQYLDQWLEAIRATLKPGSVRAYATEIRRITDRLGGRSLAKLTTLDVQRMLAALPAEWAPATRHGVYRVLRAAMRQAVRWGMLPRDPCMGVRVPAARPRDFSVWTSNEVTRFLAAAAASRYNALFRVALATGMRQGEILGLRWEDVDLKAGVVHVRHTLTWLTHETPRLEEPKTRSSRRQIPLDATTLDMLRTHRKRQLQERLAAGPVWEEHGLVFCTKGGHFVHRQPLQDIMPPLCRKAGVPVIRFHSIRHSHATLLLRAGVSPKVVAERLGHSSIKTTLDVYSHLLPDMQEAAVRVLDDLLGQRM